MTHTDLDIQVPDDASALHTPSPYLPATTTPLRRAGALLRWRTRQMRLRWRGDPLADWRHATPPAPHTIARAHRRIARRLCAVAFLAGVGTGLVIVDRLGVVLATLWVLGGVA